MASKQGSKRLSRPLLFVEVTRLFGQRSSCPRAQVGVTAIRDGRIVASGYVGAPAGMPQCDEVGCTMLDNSCVRSIHAEANLVAWAARTGVELENTEIFCTHSPCLACAKLLIQAGITAFYYMTPYKAPQGAMLLEESGIEVIHLP